jgi:DHA1 family tetracycline resistance protein-like MFS transporter
MPTPPSRAALAFVFITVVLDMMALGVSLPVLPRLVVEFLGGDTRRGAEIYGFFGTVWALMQFVFAPVLGALSDRFGRRPIILLSNLGLGLDYVLMALAPSLGWLFLGRVISGITASSFATAGAYVADVTPPERRAAGFGMLGAAFGLGFIIGPALGGLLGAIDPRLPFWVAAALSLLNFFYGALVLPESLPPARRARLAWRRANPVGALVLLRSAPSLLGLAVVHFLHRLAHDVLPSMFVIYTSYRYAWDERTVGLTLGAVGLTTAAVQAGLVRPAVARFRERAVLLAALTLGTVGFAIYGLASTSTGFWLGLPVVALWGLTGPALQGLTTRRVDASEQGRLQGAFASLLGIAGMLAPALFTFTFAAFIAVLPGAPFLLAALLLLAAMLIAAVVTRDPVDAVR